MKNVIQDDFPSFYVGQIGNCLFIQHAVLLELCWQVELLSPNPWHAWA
jgi:hypothetical protein